jgi:hypothetical protein
VLVRAGLIKPLGHPQKYCVKNYSRDLLAQQLADEAGSTGWWPQPSIGTGALKTRASGQSKLGMVRRKPMTNQRRQQRE